MAFSNPTAQTSLHLQGQIHPQSRLGHRRSHDHSYHVSFWTTLPQATKPLSKLRACCVSFNRAEVNEGWRLRSPWVQRLRGRQTVRAASSQRPLPTQGQLARRLTVNCLAQGCYHQAVKTFEELRLWNDMIFVEVPQHRRLVCSKCGGRNVKVMPIFPARRGTPRRAARRS